VPVMGKDGVNTTDSDAVSIHGTNPQNLVEKILRMRIYDNLYWKEHCFALSADSLVDKAIELQYIGGTYGGNRMPTPFICLVLKMLQIQPDKEIIVELIKNEEYKYVRALGAFYMRLVGKPLDIYQYLEPLYNDYRKLRYRNYEGFEISHMDEFVDSCLRDETFCDIAMPKMPRRSVLEDNGVLAKRISVLDDEVEDMLAAGEAEEDEDDLLAPEKPAEDKPAPSTAAAAAEARLDAAKAAQAPTAATAEPAKADTGGSRDERRRSRSPARGRDRRRSRSRSRGRNDRRRSRSGSRNRGRRRSRSRSRSRGRRDDRRHRSRSGSRKRDRKRRRRSSSSSSRSSSRSRSRSRRRRSRSRSRDRRGGGSRRDDPSTARDGAPPQRGQGREGVEPAWLTAKRKAAGESGSADGGSGSGGDKPSAEGASAPTEEKKAKKAWIKGKGVTKADGGSKPNKSKKEKKEKKKSKKEKATGNGGGDGGGASGGGGGGSADSLEIQEANALRAKLGMKPLRES
jgi:pre-mRNA-splicing factor 38A